jgi:hypothetical protein
MTGAGVDAIADTVGRPFEPALALTAVSRPWPP